MTTHEFLEHLETHTDRPLTFHTDEKAVAPGYHVTEIKAVAVHAMDCGGEASRWSETVLQVWPPARVGSDRHMSVGKFLSIYRRVAQAVPIDPEATVRVEYGDAGKSAIAYLVRSVDVGPDGVDVRLAPPAVACKGADRSVGDIPVLRSFEGLEALPTQGSACC
ncbi:MAG: DUF6428 family protein [Trueperaceae bacterium]